MKNLLGIYEKALPSDLTWKDRLLMAKKLGFDFVEISIDESDERLARLSYSKDQIGEIRSAVFETGISLPTMCFSGHRRFPLGSRDAEIRKHSLELMAKAIDFASLVGIRVIQLAGYDVYYEKGGEDTRQMYVENMRKCIKMAERKQVMLAIEIMDSPFINSITKYMEYDRLFHSPWLCVYPDLGNLTAWGNDVEKELELGFSRTVAVHLKDTLAVTRDFPGKFKEVPFGTGCVDFVKCLKVLKRLDYQGTFLIEMWSGKDADPEKEILAAKDLLLGKLAESGF